MRQISQNVTAILLQTVTEIYCKMRQVFLLQNATVLLQNVTVITDCDSFITKCDVYYKYTIKYTISKLEQLIDNEQLNLS